MPTTMFQELLRRAMQNPTQQPMPPVTAPMGTGVPPVAPMQPTATGTSPLQMMARALEARNAAQQVQR